MRNSSGGYLVSSGPNGVVEHDTDVCGHCNGIVIMKVGQQRGDVGGVCKQCMQFVCDRCYSKVRCDPFEEKLKRIEARGDALRSYGLDCR